MHFAVVDAAEYGAVVVQQVSRQFQARVHERQPAAWKRPPILVFRPGEIGAGEFGEVVLVQEILAGVVGQVDIDNADLAQITFLQQFQGVEIAALDEAIARAVEIDAVLDAREQRQVRSRLRRGSTARLPGQSR